MSTSPSDSIKMNSSEGGMVIVKFEKLFEPGQIGKLKLKNRIVMPAMVTLYSNFNGEVTDRMIQYYAERARGGVGLVIVEFTKAEYTLEYCSLNTTLRIDALKHMTEFYNLSEAIHLNGAKAVLQVTPGGGSWIIPKELWPAGFQSIGPTTFACPGSEARAMSTAEVEQLVELYGLAAWRAKYSGFDGIEIHGHASYLLAQFMTPYVNKRTDKYGELWRLPVELVQSAKSHAGADFTVIFRLSGDEFLKGGRTLEGSKEICKRVEEAGADAIDVSGGTYYTDDSNRVFPYMTLPRGIFVPQAAEIKKVVKIPIIVPGRLNNPVDAERVLEEGKADFVGVGRGLIADPEWPKKTAEGRVADIRPCISCNECIGNQIIYARPIHCTVNPIAGKERDYRIKATDKPKKVLVIGGGPGGMQAASVAAERGHKVTLYEKADQLGGALIDATVAEYKKDLRPLLAWLMLQVKEAGVKVELNKEVTPEMVSEMKPDVAIVAVGATPLVPEEIPGIREPITVMALDVLHDRVKVGDNVIVGGGGAVGCDVAAYLADKGKKVTIVELFDIATDVESWTGSRGQLLITLEKKGVTWHTYTKLKEVTDEGIIVADKEGKDRTMKADTVVVALGFEPRTELQEKLTGKGPELYTIGDCVEARKLGDAIREGFYTAISI